ncbi:MAG: DNA repair protein RecN [Ignavibacteriaceae bacterium]|nr:DNA repair protein RecN [Ignavibacteriaceae bacterium]
MLKALLVKDYALIESINIEFGKGLNIITGETGAGKSILVDAMSLLLGERASTEVIRKGASKSYVEGIFDITNNKKIDALLEENEIEPLPELILRREISIKGSNRCFINDTPVSLALIKNVGNLMVDLHGQHEHQSLLRNETHIDFLDEFGKYHDLIDAYKQVYLELQNLLKELKVLKEKEASLKEKKDFYSFQIKEIDSVSPAEDEEEKLVEELRILENSEKLADTSSSVYGLIYEDENSVYDSITKIKIELDELNEIDKSFSESLSECVNAIALINDIAEFVRNYKSKIEVEPIEVNRKRDRLGAINLIKKKYGGSVHAVIEYRNKIGAEYDLAENFSAKINSYEKQIAALREQCGKAADNISKKRIQASSLINKEVKEVLTELGIPDSNFNVRITQNNSSSGEDYITLKENKYSYSAKGIDEVEFYISTNVGEDLKPLAKVASGGEVSRIMLSLKTILAKNDRFPLLIFDEIDTGVSGRIAQKVGKALKSLANFYQVISITHLPQIAGLADHHFIVEKKTNDGRVVSSIKKLTENERVKEVAKLMSGENVTEASLEGARELINSR